MWRLSRGGASLVNCAVFRDDVHALALRTPPLAHEQ
jgi:hypothetical protein